MIITDQVENKPVLSSAITDTNQFTIKNSAKAFYILSTSLYADPRLAILRELGCNARDSHVEAGQTKPWRLHLPTIVNPMLEIEDYGVGLDHDQVMNMFTTFFESTKTNSNEFVGALGLGSKSPFSYTDNYTVVATKNGIRNTYSAYKTDAGVPAIARLHTEKTDACNGVLIQIAVKTQDFNDFINKASQAYEFFDQKPECNKPLSVTSLRPFKPFDADLGVEHDTGYNRSSVVIMGGIGYKIDIHRKEFQKYINLLNHKIVLRAKIGDVEMTPSREGLTYNSQTTDWIVSKLEEVQQKIVSELEKKVASYTSNWELAKFLHVQKNNSLYRTAVDALLVKYFPSGKMPELEFTKDELQQQGITLERYVYRNGKKAKPKSQPEQIRVTVGTYEFNHFNAVFMFDDSKVRVMDMTNNRSVDKNIYLFKSKNPKAVEFLKQKLQPTEFSLLLTSVYITKVQSVKKEKTEFFEFDLVETGGYYNKKKVLKAERSTSTSIPSRVVYWVPMKGVKVDVDEQAIGLKINADDVNQFIKNNPHKVIGFGKTSKTSKGKLINLIDHLQDKLDKEFDRAKTQLGAMQAAIQYWSVYGYGQLPDISVEDLPLLEDKLLAAMIQAKNDNKETFVYLTKFRYHIPNFEADYKKVSNHVSSTYAAINFSHSSKKSIELINFVYKNKI